MLFLSPIVNMSAVLSWTPDALLRFHGLLEDCNNFLANHENSDIYRALQTLVPFDGFHLETKPCSICSMLCQESTSVEVRIFSPTDAVCREDVTSDRLCLCHVVDESLTGLMIPVTVGAAELFYGGDQVH